MSKVQYHIRPATAADLATIQRLNAELFKFELELNGYSRDPDWPYSPEGAAYFTKCCTGQDKYGAFVAEIDGRPVGYLAASVYAKTWMAMNPVAELENMYVEASHRHQGIGSGLMEAFKAWAKDHGAQRLKVGALAGNHPALAFYRKHGFHDLEIVLEQPFEA